MERKNVQKKYREKKIRRLLMNVFMINATNHTTGDLSMDSAIIHTFHSGDGKGLMPYLYLQVGAQTVRINKNNTIL